MKYGEGELAGDQLDEKNNVHAKTQQKLSAAMSIVINWLLQVSHHTWVAEIHGKKTNTYEKVVLPPARSAVGAELLQVAGQEPSKRRGPSEKLVGEPGTITLGLQVSVDSSTVRILQNVQAISLEEEWLIENQEA